MRRKRERILSFVSGSSKLPKTVREYRETYNRLGEKLDEHAEILDRIHRDLSKLSEGGKRGRAGDFTSETLLRALIIMMVEGLSCRETTVRIAESEFFQDFIRTRKKAVMEFTFLNRAFKAVHPETWKRVNEILGQPCVESGEITPEIIRTEATKRGQVSFFMVVHVDSWCSAIQGVPRCFSPRRYSRTHSHVGYICRRLRLRRRTGGLLTQLRN